MVRRAKRPVPCQGAAIDQARHRPDHGGLQQLLRCQGRQEAGQARGNVLIHCASGNRVGALVALHARGTGATPDEALALGKAAGLAGLEPAVRARLDATP